MSSKNFTPPSEWAPPERIRSLPECAALAGLSHMTLRREIRAGRGPVITRLSPGRIGITDRDWAVWVESRRQPVESAE